MIDSAALHGAAALVAELGIGIATSAAYDWLKTRFGSGQHVSREDLERELQALLDVQGAEVRAATVIDMWAAQGVLRIAGSNLYAPDQITMGAGKGAAFSFGDGSKSETDKTGIVAGTGARITGSNAAIRQNPDGSISFHVGKK